MIKRIVLVAGALLTLFAVLGALLPGWVIFLLTLALAKGLVVLGVALLMRAGLVSFGQGLFFAGGAYAAGLALNRWGVYEAGLLLLLAIGASLLLAAVVGLLIARYREIFFAMLSLAFSMTLYGVLVKAYAITGGTDGLSLPLASITILGQSLPTQQLPLAFYYLTLFSTGLVVYLLYRYSQAPLGYVARAIKDNEVRVSYLGASVQRAIYRTYLLAAATAGLGGAFTGLTVGHIDPNLAYWTTSGEFVFASLLGGITHVFAPLAGSIVLEFLGSYARAFAPYRWQMILGSVMLLIILFLPGGLWTLYERLTRRIRA